MLRRIIRRAVRHAFLLGAEQLVTPALVDATVAVMGGAYPDIVKQHELVLERREPRGGALPPDARARPRSPRRRARPRRRHRRRRVLPARHARVPDRPHARDRGGARPRASTSTASTPRMAEQRTRAEGSAQGRRRQGRGRAARALPRAARRARPHRLHRPPGVRDRGRQGARAGRRSRPPRAGGRRHAGARGARPHAVLRGVRWPGRRHRRHRDVAAARGCGSTTRSTALPGLVLHRGVVERGHDRTRATRRSRASTAPAATRSAATTPPRTSCTGRCARCSGQHVQAGRFVRRPRPAALRLQPLRSGHPRPARPRSRRWRTPR